MFNLGDTTTASGAGVAVAVEVGVFVGILVAVGVEEGMAVGVGEKVAVGVAEGVGVGGEVEVGVGEGVTIRVGGGAPAVWVAKILAAILVARELLFSSERAQALKIALITRHAIRKIGLFFICSPLNSGSINGQFGQPNQNLGNRIFC